MPFSTMELVPIAINETSAASAKSSGRMKIGAAKSLELASLAHKLYLQAAHEECFLCQMIAWAIITKVEG